MNTLSIRFYLIFPTFNNFRSTNFWITRNLVTGDMGIFWGGNWCRRGTFPKGTKPSRYFTSNQLGSISTLSSSFKNIFCDFSWTEVLVVGDLSILWGWIYSGRCSFQWGTNPNRYINTNKLEGHSKFEIDFHGMTKLPDFLVCCCHWCGESSPISPVFSIPCK